MKIAIDIDDTLSEVDRATALKKYIEENNFPFKIVEPNAHALLEVCDWTRDEMMRFVEGGGISLFTKAPVRNGARETIEKWKAAGHEIIILTARVTEWFGDAVGVSRKWLDENGIPYDKVVTDIWEKGAYCREHGIEILIEDNFEICLKAQELGVKAVMFLDKHNLAHTEEIAYGGANWQAIGAAVEAIRMKLQSQNRG